MFPPWQFQLGSETISGHTITHMYGHVRVCKIASHHKSARGAMISCALLLLVAINAGAHGDLDIRIRMATDEIAKDTNNPSLYLHRAELHREHKDWPAASNDYDSVARLDPTAKNVDFYRGRMLADAGDFASAKERFDRYLSNQPKDGLGFVERGRVFVKLGARTNAIADYSAGLKLLNEPQPEFFIELAQVFCEDKQDEEALRVLDEGVRRLGPVVTLQVLGIDIELKQKKYDAALARLDTIIAQAARKENWYAQRGDIELLAGRPAEAQQAYEDCLTAITRLPVRLQTLPPIMNLKARVKASIEKATTPPAATKP